MVIIFTHSFSAAPLSSSTWYKPTLAMGIRSSGTLAPGVGRAGAMRWPQFKKGYFLAANILYDTFSSKFTMTELCRYISKGIWIAMNVSLETSFRMSVRPVEKVFCLFALIVLVVSCFLCFSFLTKNTPGWFNLTNYTRHVESRECKVCFQSYPFCPTSDFNLVLFVTLLISINPICPTSDLIVPVSIIPDFRCFQSNIFCPTSDLIIPNWIIPDFR